MENITNILNLEIQQIREKEFHIESMGYSPAEVDRFLDLVVDDYKVYQKTISDLQKAEEELMKYNVYLRKRLIELEEKSGEPGFGPDILGPSDQIDVVALFERLARLDEHLHLSEKGNDNNQKSK